MIGRAARFSDRGREPKIPRLGAAIRPVPDNSPAVVQMIYPPRTWNGPTFSPNHGPSGATASFYFSMKL